MATVATVILVLVVVLLLFAAGIGIMGTGMMGGGMMGGAMFGMPLLGLLFMLGLPLLFVGGVVLLGVAIVRGAGVPIRPDAPQQSSPAPLEILKVRYAKGEINHDQFNEMRRQLEQ